MENNIKANELRIGNWVYISDNYTLAFYKQETQINIHNMMYLCGETKEPLDFTLEPIPLTKEWLLKFGFKANEYDDEFTLLDMMLDCEYTDENTYNLSIGKQQFSIDIMYVHQLQNLYFALTNEELTMK